ncbi:MULTISPECIES: hypothetical protein [Nocardiopsis]|uniref:Uncharacterized protein n=1 Tax=Nocardiopsis sinuspersici TaxID=501010 RepID=A0A1V3BV23_9ACTN|nr:MULTISPECIES: hypothetical protein [Nocardiopsis]OOC52494.1 hypothetical protein NOSIN_00465 [Nocardiopsis sinuspersici]
MKDTSQLVERAATTLAGSMTTHDEAAWRSALEGFAALFTAAAHVAAAELERSRAKVVADPGLAAEAAGEWKPKLRRLLRTHPEAAERLQALLRELGANAPQAGVSHQSSGTVSGTAVQAHTLHGGVTNTHNHEGGDHVDFSDGTFQGEVVGKKVERHENTRVDQSRARAGRDVIGTQNNHHGDHGSGRES